MRHQLEIQLVDSPAAFPRVVASLHAHALRIEQVHLSGQHCTLTVVGAAPGERVTAVLRRLVDVRSAGLADFADTTQVRTRYVVNRQASGQRRPAQPLARRGTSSAASTHVAGNAADLTTPCRG